MTTVQPRCDKEAGTSPYLNLLNKADIVASGGYVMRNDRFGALILKPGGYIEQYERLPDGRLERTTRDPDGSITSRSDDLIPDAAAEAEAAWKLGPERCSEARRLLDLCVRHIVQASPERQAEATEEAMFIAELLEGEDLLDAGTAGRLDELVEHARSAANRKREPIRDPISYGRRAVELEVARFLETPDDEWDLRTLPNHLGVIAQRLGALVRDGVLDRKWTEEVLVLAGRAHGLPPATTEYVVRVGLDCAAQRQRV